MGETQNTSVCALAKALNKAFEVSGINPGKDTIVSAVEKFSDLGLRHLVLYIENGGFLCLCSDPEMSRKLRSAIEQIENELDMEKADNQTGERNDQERTDKRDS